MLPQRLPSRDRILGRLCRQGRQRSIATSLILACLGVLLIFTGFMEWSQTKLGTTWASLVAVIGGLLLAWGLYRFAKLAEILPLPTERELPN